MKDQYVKNNLTRSGVSKCDIDSKVGLRLLLLPLHASDSLATNPSTLLPKYCKEVMDFRARFNNCTVQYY